MFGFRLFFVALFSTARFVTRLSQPPARFSYLEGHFHATRYLDGHVHATGWDATGRHIEEDFWVLQATIKATPAGLGDATETLVG